MWTPLPAPDLPPRGKFCWRNSIPRKVAFMESEKFVLRDVDELLPVALACTFARLSVDQLSCGIPRHRGSHRLTNGLP